MRPKSPTERGFLLLVPMALELHNGKTGRVRLTQADSPQLQSN
ncbi:hypothetical protein KL86DES1_21921 [uncultured Desulfovibrio sp.]|uniref:Uncharacterized protein n=1 Tax=uncultured Desulfovibrio sp. TaxID=167968 RepID=A0A212LA16_9BACT|nr:hypothetical protein KL86DES1_21921 [uncultured Desulfovibrio sp.]VZH34818.1 conserved protein of unknown function [Desulfovibrio sp. 86]